MIGGGTGGATLQQVQWYTRVFDAAGGAADTYMLPQYATLVAWLSTAAGQPVLEVLVDGVWQEIQDNGGAWVRVSTALRFLPMKLPSDGVSMRLRNPAAAVRTLDYALEV